MPMAIAPRDSLMTALSRPGWRDLMALTKPKVSLLIVFTAIVGMVLGSPGIVPLLALVFGTLGIAMASGSAATLNHILDRHIDGQMARTKRRPLVLSWVAVTHTIDAQALVLFMIIFTWTPPHFWSLAIGRRDEYAKVGIPMLPVIHGIPYTRLQIVLYTILLILCTLMPVLIGMSGLIYLAVALVLDARFLYLALALHRGDRPDLPIRTLRFSVTYLMALFGAFIADHWCRLLV
jgi:heme o synthase